MRPLTTGFVLVLFVIAFSWFARAQSGTATDQGAGSAPTGTAQEGATKDEVQQLRSEVADQRKTIEELKALVQQLAEASGKAGDGAHLVNTTLVEPVEAAQAAKPADKKPAEKKSETPVVAGWSGEHFFIKSTDGKFQIQPYGYFQSDYRAYSGDGAPSNTFLIRRARFGFQGNFGTHYDYAVLLDAAASNGLSLRDLYVNIKPSPIFQFQVGQYKEPYSQEELIPVSNLDFVERSLASLLYPAAATAFRSPGATIRGDISGGVVQYWVSAFNGKGILANNTTNEPEVIGRLRFYPWKKKKDNLFQGLAFGGAIAHGRSRGLSGEQSFSGVLPDAAYNFFPSFRINGSVERYNGESTWTHGPWAVRAEYDQLNQFRRAVGSETSDNLGFITLPGIVAKAGYGQVTYLLTGETHPENGTPKVKHPFLGPEAAGGGKGWGAWELGFRYSRIQAKEPGISLLSNPLTPGFVSTFNKHTDEFTFGVNWYLNYLVKYQVNFNVDRLMDPSVAGQVPQNFFVLLNRLQFRF
jgi:phosphate-selective porin OprO and OprP